MPQGHAVRSRLRHRCIRVAKQPHEKAQPWTHPVSCGRLRRNNPFRRVRLEVLERRLRRNATRENLDDLRFKIRPHREAERSADEGARKRGSPRVMWRVLCGDDHKSGGNLHAAAPERTVEDARRVEEGHEEGDDVRGRQVHLVAQERVAASHGEVEGPIDPNASVSDGAPLTDDVLERRTLGELHRGHLGQTAATLQVTILLTSPLPIVNTTGEELIRDFDQLRLANASRPLQHQRHCALDACEHHLERCTSRPAVRLGIALGGERETSRRVDGFGGKPGSYIDQAHWHWQRGLGRRRRVHDASCEVTSLSCVGCAQKVGERARGLANSGGR